MAFKDHFSGHASAYADARPHYPPALFVWLAGQCDGRALAWDAGCGNGQASVALAAHFARVFASDPSATQIAAAQPHARVDYRVEPAEAPTLAPASADLVTVAQALHWFDLDAFYAAVRRVLRPGGVFAAWCYGLSTVSPDVDAVYGELYDGLLDPYWPPERRHVENGYAELRFPFRPIAPPALAMTQDWTLAQYLAYLRSWSAVQLYRKARGEDPVALIEAPMARAWGDAEARRAVRWPLSFRAGRVG